MSSYFGIGLMSGNSLDGLDLCYAEFMGMPQSDVWSYRIIHTVTFAYDLEWQDRLKIAYRLTALELVQLHTEFGHFVGKKVRDYIKDEDIRVDFVVFMGHSAFHQPNKRLTFSLGDGETIAAYLPCPLVANIGTKDVALGGQGRPLMCLGDKFLYQNYNFCLNLGGQAYISCYDQAFDICPCNVLLNHLAHRHNVDLHYDEDGALAAQGQLLPALLEELNALAYYEKPRPKALCREWFDAKVLPLFEKRTASVEDQLHTAVEHIVQQILSAVSSFPAQRPNSTPTRRSVSVVRRSILITGGGAKNQHLIELLRRRLEKQQIDVVEADEQTVDFKEALISAFLGMRCLLGLTNVSMDITGSSADTVSGSIHLPPNHSLPASFMFQGR